MAKAQDHTMGNSIAHRHYRDHLGSMVTSVSHCLQWWDCLTQSHTHPHTHRLVSNFNRTCNEKKKKGILTGHFHNISRNNISGFDPLYALPVLPIHFPHLGLVFLKSLYGVLGISFLQARLKLNKHAKNFKQKNRLHIVHSGSRNMRVGWLR